MLPTPSLFRDFISQMSKDELVDFIMDKYTHYDQHDTFYFFEELILQYYQEQLSYEHLLKEITVFIKESRQGKYFEDFDFNKLGSDYIPPKTREWFSKAGVLLDLLCIYAEKNKTIAVKELFDRMFDLIQFMEESAAVVFAHQYNEADIYTNHDYRAIYEELILHLNMR